MSEQSDGKRAQEVLPGAKWVSDAVSEEETGPVIEVPSGYPSPEVEKLRESVEELKRDKMRLAAMIRDLESELADNSDRCSGSTLEDRVSRLEREVGI